MSDKDEVVADNFPAPADVEAKPVVKSKPASPVVPVAELPAVDQSETKRYFDSLDESRQKYIIKLAQNDSFDLKLVKDPSKPKSQWEYDFKNFKYYEVTVKEWTDIELKRAELNDTIEYAAKRLVTPGIPKNEEWNFRRQIAEKHVNLYRMCARAFLGMGDVEYDNADWDEVRNAIDACNHRTVYSLPNLAGISVSFTG